MPDPIPDPAIPDPVPPHTPEAGAVPPLPSAGTTGLQRNIAAALACFFSIIGGIVFLVLEKKDAFVRFYAMQSILLGAVSIAASISLGILARMFGYIPVIGWLFQVLFHMVSFMIGLGFLVVWILTIVKAFNNQEWEIPYLGPVARKQLASNSLGV